MAGSIRAFGVALGVVAGLWAFQPGSALAEPPSGTGYLADFSNDGFAWPSDVPNWDGVYLPGSVWLTNNRFEGDLFIGSGYSGFDDSSLFNAPGNAALWGHTLNGDISLNFTGSDYGSTAYVAFDFGWYNTFDNAASWLSVDAWDDDYNWLGSLTVDLNNYFLTDNSFSGVAGRVELDAGTLGWGNIGSLDIHVNSPFGNSDGTFIIDNVRYGSSAPPTPDPDNDSQLKFTFNDGTVDLLYGIGAAVLQGTWNGAYTFADEVTNTGSDATSYTLTYTGDVSAPADRSVIHVPIGGNETLPVGSMVAVANTNQPSGTYEGTLTLHNDVNPNDPGSSLIVTYQIYAPAIASANNDQVIEPSGLNEISVSNADVEAHEGALRATWQITGQTLTGSGFYIADGNLNINDLILPGETNTATVGFDPFGKVAGEHVGTYEIQMIMTAAHFPGYPEGQTLGLNGRPFEPETIIWQLRQLVTKTTFQELTVEAGSNLGQAGIGIANETTAMTLLDGTSSSTQNIYAQFVSDPNLDTSKLLGSAVELTIENLQDYYVLQLTYRDADLPNNFNELDLKLIVFDEISHQWVHAILLNSDGGEGGFFFEGSYLDYLASIDYTVPTLGAYGVDADLNHVWAVLDHNSVFGIEVPEPASIILMVAGLGAVLRRRR